MKSSRILLFVIVLQSKKLAFDKIENDDNLQDVDDRANEYPDPASQQLQIKLPSNFPDGDMHLID